MLVKFVDCVVFEIGFKVILEEKVKITISKYSLCPFPFLYSSPNELDRILNVQSLFLIYS